MDDSSKLHEGQTSRGQKPSRHVSRVKYDQCRRGANLNSAVVLFALEGTLVIISLVTWFADTLTDILVSFGYFESGDTRWGALTLVLVFLPSLIIQLFSARWYYSDGKMTGCYPWLVHIFLMQPLERYLFVLVAGWRAYKSRDPDDIESYYYQQNDVCMLRLFEAFLESAPQLTLQVYIMVATNCATWLTGVSACMSLLALGWSVTAYNHALRKAYRENYVIFWPSLLLQTLWHISMVASRVCSLVLFTCLYKAWVFLFLGIHWIIMTVWVILQDTDFSPSIFEERFFNGVAGVIYCFCFFSLKEGATRWRMIFFYGLMLLESAILMGIWYPIKESKQWYDYALFITVFTGFFFGLCCMLLYYRCCHPSRPICCCQKFEEQSPDQLKAPYIPSPAPPSRNSSCEEMKVDGFLRLSSASFFPRRSTLLKTQSKIMHVEYKEVATPSQLSPIKDGSPLRPSTPYDQTFEMADTPGFHHYSVNASECLEESSYCNTLQGTGIDLSCMTPQQRNKSILPRNILQNELVNFALSNLLNDHQKEYIAPCSPTKTTEGRASIIAPSGYLGSPEEKVALNNEVTGDCMTPEESPLLGNHYSIRNRDMISTPLVQTNRSMQPRLPLPDFTPIHPSVTPYLKTMRRIDDWEDDSFTELHGINGFLRINHPDEATASLNVSQYDSFQTCEDDSIYYETCDEIDNPPVPGRQAQVHHHSSSEHPDSVTTTDTEYVTTDTEYTSATDTGYATSNS